LDWADELKRRAAAFPEEIREAHRRSSNHRAEIMASQSCGCFYCGAIFPPERVEEWVDEVDGVGQTALCPECGIDSVLGDRVGGSISRGFLQRMKDFWFGDDG
jgi:hypothetical protein